jgi:Na+/glutamate symporter
MQVSIAEQGPIGLGLIAGLIGFIAGEFLVKNKKVIQIEGKSESETQEILEKLRKKARIKNAR